MPLPAVAAGLAGDHLGAVDAAVPALIRAVVASAESLVAGARAAG